VLVWHRRDCLKVPRTKLCGVGVPCQDMIFLSGRNIQIASETAAGEAEAVVIVIVIVL
jgi:hypothetical protein